MPSMVQIMACCLFGTKPLSEPMLPYSKWTIGNKIQWSLYWNTAILILWKEFKNVVCKRATILSCPQCLNKTISCGPWQTMRLVWCYKMELTSDPSMATNPMVALKSFTLRITFMKINIYLHLQHLSTLNFDKECWKLPIRKKINFLQWTSFIPFKNLFC